MKFFSTILFLFVISINPSKSQSLAETINGCKLQTYISEYGTLITQHEVYILECKEFQHNYLPYIEEFKNLTDLYMKGNFSELTINSSYKNLKSISIYSSNLQKCNLESYTNFTHLVHIDISKSKQEVKLDLTGAEKLKHLLSLHISDNKMVDYSCGALKSSTLKSLTFTDNYLKELDFSCFPKSTEYLSVSHNKVSTVRSLDALKNLSNLVILTLKSIPLSFSLSYLPKNIRYVNVERIEAFDTQSCQEFKQLLNLDRLYVSDSVLPYFNLTCLPRNIGTLSLGFNGISTFNTDSSHCSHMKNLASLRQVDLWGNNLHDFRFKCLPESIEHIFVANNYIAELPDLVDIPHSHRVWVDIRRNPIRCTCFFLRDWVQLLDTGNVKFIHNNEDKPTITCSNVDSELVNYPWSNNATAIKLHDASALGCLTGGEDENN